MVVRRQVLVCLGESMKRLLGLVQSRVVCPDKVVYGGQGTRATQGGDNLAGLEEI